MSDTVRLFKEYYSEFGQGTCENLGDIYHRDITFKDPLHEVTGLVELKSYFSSMNEGLVSCRFVFDESACIAQDDVAWLKWRMDYQHDKLASGKLLSLNGASIIKYQDKIIYHEDFYDLGEMIYRRVPVLGFVINKINAKLLQK